jgi:O-antigen/teichoic acid export membrane protein
MQRLTRQFSGNALRARALRGSALTVIQFGGANVLRLAANLVLTRILFPEAFGLMALVQVFVVGLQMFSDIGIQTSVIRSPRGEDPKFLHTAWTVQVFRGIVLWLGCVALAAPAATFYDEPDLQTLLPVVALNAVFLGFASINVFTVNRNLMLGRLTLLELGSQLIGSLAMIGLALAWESVWALVIGGLFGTFLHVILTHVVLPGGRMRFMIEREAFWEIFGFGKWLFVSSAAGFLIGHGDKAILGKYITLTDLALYNLAMQLVLVPMLMNNAMLGRIMFPLYVNRPPAESTENRAKIFQARILLSAGTFVLILPLVFFGRQIIEFLYDPRYYDAGIILVGISAVWLFQIITTGHSQVLLATGESRLFAALQVGSAALRATLMLFGAMYFGIPGVALAALVAEITIYPVLVALAGRRKSWDWRHDLLFAGVALASIMLLLAVNPVAWGDFIALAQPASGR